jgi:hypothetical protein
MNTVRLHEIEALGRFRLRRVPPMGMSREFKPERRLGQLAEKLLRGTIRAFT